MSNYYARNRYHLDTARNYIGSAICLMIALVCGWMAYIAYPGQYVTAIVFAVVALLFVLGAIMLMTADTRRDQSLP